MTKPPATALWVLLLLILPGTAWSDEAVSLDQALKTALSANERLAVSKARSEALNEVPTRVGSLPDPSLKLNAMNLPVDTFAVGQEAMTQLQVGISQMLPFPGKLALKSDAATNAAAAAEADSAEIRQEVIRDVTSAWWHLYYLDRALEIVDSNQDLLRQLVTIAQSKYSVGQGLQQDVLLAQLELSKLLDLALALESDREDGSARLNMLMGWPSEQEVSLPAQADGNLPQMLPVPKLAELADRNRPKLAASARRVKMAGARLALAQKEHLPDVMLSAAYGVRSGTNPNGNDRPDFATLMLSLNLPIDREDRQDRLVAQRRFELDARRSAERAAQDKVLEQISSAHARYHKARERVTLLKTGIIPQAEQTVASMRAGYQVNKVDFLNLVRAQITLYNYETRYWKTLASAKSALSRLEAAVGASLTGKTKQGTEKATQ